MRRRLSPDERAQRGDEGGERDGAAPNKASDPGAEVPLETDADASSIAILPLREDAGALTVVGLGGSAGSIAPLQAFFENISPTSGSAYVVVLHLSPEYESHLPEVLARSSPVPVHQVTQSVRIEANQVYVIPPGKDLEMRDGTLELLDPERTQGRRIVIDTFFRTLAAAHGPQAAAVVFSGTGADGTLGIRQIKESGGLVVAQSPSEAEFDAMPRSAIATGMVDYVLPVTTMPAHIAAYWATSRRMRIPAEASPSSEQHEEGADQEVALHDILTHVRAQTGHDFAFYKRATVLRRIGRRMQVNGMETLLAYRDFLRSHPAEVGDLIGDLLISVTQFFRDPEAWLALERDVIPQLFVEKASSEGEIRAWVCGCATGEEAYTLAILLLEQAERMPHPPRVQVFATDMNAPAINRARLGIYPETIAGDLSEERLRRWFYRLEGSYQVRKEVREVVLFADHDVLRDTPFSRLDLVTCRNLLIYLNRAAQERVFRIFHFALSSDRFVLLGPSESAEGVEGLFVAANKKQRLFTRRAVPRSLLPPLSIPLVLPNAARGSEAVEKESAFATPLSVFSSQPGVSSGNNVSRDLLPRYGPPVVVVNEEYTIVHLSGSVSDFLRLPEGEPTYNLLELVQPELRPELRGALFGAAQEGTEQTRVVRSAAHEEGGEISLFSTFALRLSVRPVPASPPADTPSYFVVQFEKLSERVLAALRPLLSEVPLPHSPSVAGDDTQAPDVAYTEAAVELARHLEQENAAIQRNLRLASEQYDAVTEELKASNEEMQATNEEMRSVVEELETGKEELQSVNEELSTVNYELKARVEELTTTNSDLSNFLGATDIATLFLDRVLNIKRFTSAALALFNLIPSDIGRPLAHVTNRLDYPTLEDDAKEVLARLIPIEHEITTTDSQRHLLARLLPYRSLDDRIEGLVVTFMDVTEQKRAEQAVRRSEARQSFLLDLGDAIRPLSDPLEIQQTAMRVLGEHLQADRVLYSEIETDDRHFVIADNYVRGNVPKMIGRFPLSDYDNAQKSQRRGETFVLPDIRSAGESDERAAFLAVGVQALIGVPLHKDGRWVASLSVHQGSPCAWSPEETALVSETAERTWAAVERARAEAALAKSEEKYRTLFESIDEGVATIEVLFDEQDKAVDYRILEINPAHEAMSGLGRDLVGKRIREIIPTIEETVIERVGQVALTGEPLRFEEYVSGLDRWFDIYLSQVGGAGSRKVASISQNITERKCREANLAFLADVSQDLVRLTNIDETMNRLGAKIGAHFRASQCAFGLVGDNGQSITLTHEWKPMELPSLKGTYRIAEYHTEEFQRASRAGETFVVRDAADDARVTAAEMTALGIYAFVSVPLVRDGEWRFNLTIVDAAPRDWRTDEIELLREITSRIWTRLERARAEEALRESQNQLRLALDAAELGTFRWYPQEDRSELDARTFTLFGRREGDTVTLATALATTIHTDDREFYAAAVARAVDPNGDGKLDVDYRIVHPDGSLHWLHIYGQTFFEGENPPLARLMYGMLLDITERKRREANLVFLAETSADFSPLIRPEDIMECVSSRLADHLDLSRCNFSVVDEEANSIECIYAWRRDDSMPDVSGAHRISSFLSEEGRRHYAAGNFAVINDVRNNSLLNPATLEFYDELGLRSILDAPYLKDGRWKFQLTAARSEASEWRTDEIELVRELAERIYLRIERAYAEKALQQSEARFRTLGEAVPMGLWMADAAGNPLYQNPAWHQYTGMTREELAVSGWEALHHPEDLSWLRQLWEEAVQQGKPIEVETRMRRHDGVYRWFACRTVPVEDEQGRIVKWVGTGLDIEEQKRAQQSLGQAATQLRLVTDAAPVYIAQCDRQARFKFVNRPYAQRFGLTVAECIGKRISEVVGEAAYASFSPYVERVLQGEAVEFDIEVPYEAIGSHFMHCSYVPEFDAEGTVIGLVAAISDITERKRAEETLSERNQEVETLNRRLKWAMAETHHRVKNNLQIILALIDIRCNAEEMIPMSELTRLSANVRALSIIHDILTQEAKSGSDQETLSAKAVLDRLIQGLEQTTGGRSLSSTIEDVRLAARRTTALAIVTNELVSNALKHGKGQTEIVFRVNDSHATLVLCDDGPGFPKDFNAETAAHTGLELVENIATWDLQGQIVYDNRPEGGARITVTFPLIT